MEKVIEKVDNLINIIDKKCAIKIKELNKKIQEDKSLLELLEKYRITKSEELKQEITNNKLFREYKDEETEINLLIMAINSRLKKLTKNKECNL